jgi:hypothetical protein
MGASHATRGWPWMATPGLRGAWKAQRNGRLDYGSRDGTSSSLESVSPSAMGSPHTAGGHGWPPRACAEHAMRSAMAGWITAPGTVLVRRSTRLVRRLWARRMRRAADRWPPRACAEHGMRSEMAGSRDVLSSSLESVSPSAMGSSHARAGHGWPPRACAEHAMRSAMAGWITAPGTVLVRRSRRLVRGPFARRVPASGPLE